MLAEKLLRLLSLILLSVILLPGVIATTAAAQIVKPVAAEPQLTATAAIAVDIDTGQILYAKNPNLQLPMASTTKIMTALTLFTIDGVNMNDYIEAVDGDMLAGTTMNLYPGQRVKIMDLLFGLLLNSGNDAAMALARYAGNFLPGKDKPITKFVAQMNEYAVSLGLKNSHFMNPHGLDEEGHHTSVTDLAMAGWYALHNPIISVIVRLNSAQLDSLTFYSTSSFISRYPGATGIKTGDTDGAGFCVVASATRAGHNAIIVLLHSDDDDAESDLLMNYAFSKIMGTTSPVSTKIGNPKSLGYIGLAADSELLPLTTDNEVDEYIAREEKRLIHQRSRKQRSVNTLNTTLQLNGH